MAIIGQQLLQPEAGWKRYDDSYQLLKYSGRYWTTAKNQIYYNNITMFIPEGSTFIREHVVTFKFYGTGLRLIQDINNDYSKNMVVVIDGIEQTQYSLYNDTYKAQILTFDINNLSNTYHTVSIYSNEKRWALDAVDIKDGFILHENEVIYIEDLVPGKRIRCHYQATSNQVGLFSNLGKEVYVDGINDFIPAVSSATPNGCFYFLCVGYDENGKIKLVADRNIQHSISWDKINEAGFVYGVENALISNEDNLIPLMTSNIAPEGEAFASSVLVNTRTYEPFLAFNRTNIDNHDCWAANGNNGFLGYKFVSSQNIKYFLITSQNSTIFANTAPKSIIFEGSNDGINYVTLKTVSNIVWGRAETKMFHINNDQSFLYYRINCDGATQGLCVANFQMFHSCKNATIRLLSGGVSTSDKNNEWDKIIVESNLNNTIAAGDNLIWNWSGVGSWTSTSCIGSATNRVGRGGYTAKYWVDGGSSTVAANTGFRPVLLLTPESPQTLLFLLKNAQSYYTFLDNVLTAIKVADEPLTTEDFAQGFTDISQFLAVPSKQEFEIYAYSTYTSIPEAKAQYGVNAATRLCKQI